MIKTNARVGLSVSNRFLDDNFEKYPDDEMVSILTFLDMEVEQ